MENHSRHLHDFAERRACLCFKGMSTPLSIWFTTLLVLPGMSAKSTTHVDLAVLGNHDRMSINKENLNNQHPVVRDSIEYTRKKLSNEQVLLLSSLKSEIYFEDMYITHSLGDDYLRSKKDLIRLINHASPETRYIFFGHTHVWIL